MSDKPVHHEKNLKRTREILGVKQDALAIELGEDWNQQKISLLEQKEEIDPKVLDQLAKALKVTPEAIKNFNEEATINFISNTFTDNQFAGYTVNNNPTFNPLDKVVELYERMLKEKDAEIESLKKQAGERKK